MTPETLVVELDTALKQLSPLPRPSDPEWIKAETTCAELVQAIRGAEPPMPRVVFNALNLLRKQRLFGWMTRVAEALMYIDQGTPFVRRQYAQALIELGMLVAAQQVLEGALPLASNTPEEVEIEGLMGRVQKQWYVTGAGARRNRDRETLQRAIDHYRSPYLKDPRENYWHGINVVALAERGRMDGLAVSAGASASEIASSILTVLEEDERKRADGAPLWNVGTMMEALLALGRNDDMLQRAREYVTHPSADGFAMASTLRQLTEVWKLSPDTPPGSSVIPLLRAKLLRDGGSLTFEAKDINRERERAMKLELVHGFEGFQTLQWYVNGLNCCDAIARIETANAEGVGTGWLVRAGDCFPNGGDEPLLITNAHVISPADRPYPRALLPENAIANFQVKGFKSEIDPQIVWTSPVAEFDCTIVRLKTRATFVPLQLSLSRVRQTVPPPRMYVIGYPGGRDLQFSLQDNYLLGCNERLLHYRTPTEGGSSGSPVFNNVWQAVGLHHAGDGKLARLDDQPGTYEANEGIAITALLKATIASALPGA